MLPSSGSTDCSVGVGSEIERGFEGGCRWSELMGAWKGTSDSDSSSLTSAGTRSMLLFPLNLDPISRVSSPKFSVRGSTNCPAALVLAVEIGRAFRVLYVSVPLESILDCFFFNALERDRLRAMSSPASEAVVLDLVYGLLVPSNSGANSSWRVSLVAGSAGERQSRQIP